MVGRSVLKRAEGAAVNAVAVVPPVGQKPKNRALQACVTVVANNISGVCSLGCDLNEMAGMRC